MSEGDLDFVYETALIMICIDATLCEAHGLSYKNK